MFELKIITHFAAAHQLRNFKGACEKLHGHNWKIEVCISGTTLDDNGLLIDFKKVKDATKIILSKYDHTFLNELPQFTIHNPTSENIAAGLFGELSKKLNNSHVKITSVTAWESDSACATFSP